MLPPSPQQLTLLELDRKLDEIERKEKPPPPRFGAADFSFPREDGWGARASPAPRASPSPGGDEHDGGDITRPAVRRRVAVDDEESGGRRGRGDGRGGGKGSATITLSTNKQSVGGSRSRRRRRARRRAQLRPTPKRRDDLI